MGQAARVMRERAYLRGCRRLEKGMGIQFGRKVFTEEGIYTAKGKRGIRRKGLQGSYDEGYRGGM